MPTPLGREAGLISIVVPTRNRRVLAEPCIHALIVAIQQDGDAELIVVDQQSTDGLFRFLEGLSGVRVYSSSEQTVAGLRNEGVLHARGKWVYFVDSDVLVPSGQLRVLRSVFAESHDAIVGCTYTLPVNPHWVERAWYEMSAKKDDREISYINAGNLAMPRAAFERVGGFNTAFATGEDVELCARARRAGLSVRQFRALGAAHLGNPKSLSEFFRKQLWHGSGATPGDRVALFSLGAMLSTMAFAVSLIGRVVAGNPSCRVVFLVGLAALSFPLFAYLLKCWQQRKPLDPFTSVVLLYSYFAARSMAWLRARLS